MGTKYFIKGRGIEGEVEDLKAKIETLETAVTSKGKKTVKKRKKRTAVQTPPEEVEARIVELDQGEEPGW